MLHSYLQILEKKTKNVFENGLVNTGQGGSYYSFFEIQNSLSVSLTLSQTSLVFMCLQYKSFGNTVGKGEIA